ncbi:hypothetical protein BKA70DRAFT_1455464 [Coprinopsis sp. MPI-PUGE-AT-0042]|nr:hypothetical protein BKA70DRAFT_1455464 [Coprinopsis sp. MPI-PUGE-AT-0042]
MHAYLFCLIGRWNLKLITSSYSSHIPINLPVCLNLGLCLAYFRLLHHTNGPRVQTRMIGLRRMLMSYVYWILRLRMGETGSATGIIKRPPSDERTFWVVTSPNEYYIPFVVIGIRHVKAWRDGRYGLDDCTQHPQYFTEDFYWMSCIPRTVNTSVT